jgi:hypothetical protein
MVNAILSVATFALRVSIDSGLRVGFMGAAVEKNPAHTSAAVRVNTPGYEKGLFSPWTGCGYREAPGPFLADCEETLPENVPDISGTWSVWVEEKQRYHVERIEQCGLRVTVTTEGIVHDAPKANGVLADGVHDVAGPALPKCVPIRISFTFDRNEETGQVCLNMWALNAVHATSRCPTTDGRLHLQWGTTVDKMMSKVDPDQLPNWNPERNDLASRT